MEKRSQIQRISITGNMDYFLDTIKAKGFAYNKSVT
jgi:hypothetical protein